MGTKYNKNQLNINVTVSPTIRVVPAVVDLILYPCTYYSASGDYVELYGT